MTRSSNSLPLVHPLPRDFCVSEAFAALSRIDGCLWLDSAAQISIDSDPDHTIPNQSQLGPLGRYSFLSADPLRQLTAWIGDSDPWPTLQSWYREMPVGGRQELPPFQGGIAGVIGYKAATWLEKIPTPPTDDLPTPAICLGLYDWTIAVDHHLQRAWLICQGWQRDETPLRRHYAAAVARRDQVLAWLSAGTSSPLLLEQPDFAAPFGYPTIHDGVQSSFAPGEFAASVGDIVRRIYAGDCFQVNLAQRLVVAASDDPVNLYQRLRCINPAPFAGYFVGDEFTLLSSSPEGFLTLRDGVVQTRPIKGTRPRTGDPVVDAMLGDELLQSEKDRAENIMIVDLMRNDLARACSDESVIVRKLCQIERYQFVQHLVSVVEGRLRHGSSIVDLLRACFPGGSVTGAPKIEAMRIIAELEPNPRGPYCGSLGYISCTGAADFNILIRCITQVRGQWVFPVGGGITARSEPKAEEAETWTKAVGMLRSLNDPA